LEFLSLLTIFLNFFDFLLRGVFMLFERKNTRVLNVGGIKIGGEYPIAVQSMCNTDTRNVFDTVNQIKKLQNEGCEIIRVAVPDMAAAEALGEIKKNIDIPLVADIHFDYRLALKAIENGVDKLRINPGNIGGEENVRAVAKACKKRNIPIRIGVNSGSLEKDILEKYGKVTPEGLVESALRHIAILEKNDFYDIIISIKASDVPFTAKAYSILSQKVDYPLHLGITEAGTVWSGSIKSAAGIGLILGMGIGDTIRVSLTGDPTEEVKVGKEILKSLGLRKFGIEFISCPTCGRTEIDLISIAEEVEKRCSGINKNIKVAVMGCVVNGPGEAKEADIGIAGGNGVGLIFKKGVISRKVQENQLVDELIKEIMAF